MSRVLAVAVALGLAAGLVGCDSKAGSGGKQLTEKEKQEQVEKMKGGQQAGRPAPTGAGNK